MPTTKHEQQMATQYAGQGDRLRQMFQDLLAGNQSTFGDVFGLLQGIFPQIYGENGVGGAMPDMGGDLPGKDFQLPEFTSEGLSPQALAALRGKGIDSLNSNFDSSMQNLRASLARRGLSGGGGPMSGLSVDPLAGAYQKHAMDRAGALRDVTLADENQRFLNRRDLSVPARQQALQMMLGKDANELERRKLVGGQETDRRKLLLDALSGGNNMLSMLNQQAGLFGQGMDMGMDAYGNGVNSRIGARSQDSSWWGQLGQNLLPALAGSAVSAFMPTPRWGGGSGGNVPSGGRRV